MPQHSPSTYDQITPAQIARTNMVESQLRPSKVYNTDLLEAMLNVPREAFLPGALKPLAYNDASLRIAGERYMTEPLIAARLLESAGITKQTKVLIVGGGTGYLPVIASRMAGHVISIETDDGLRGLAETATCDLGIVNVEIRGGTLSEGHPDGAPYGAIVIDGAVAAVPPGILDQLEQGGRLVTILCDSQRSGAGGAKSQGVVIERVGASFSSRSVFDAFTPFLPGFTAKPVFEFS